MAKKTFTLNAFAGRQLADRQMQQTKGGYKHITGIPGGSGSTGLIDWGEIEVREYHLVQIHSIGNVVEGKLKSGN